MSVKFDQDYQFALRSRRFQFTRIRLLRALGFFVHVTQGSQDPARDQQLVDPGPI